MAKCIGCRYEDHPKGEILCVHPQIVAKTKGGKKVDVDGSKARPGWCPYPNAAPPRPEDDKSPEPKTPPPPENKAGKARAKKKTAKKSSSTVE